MNRNRKTYTCWFCGGVVNMSKDNTAVGKPVKVSDEKILIAIHDATDEDNTIIFHKECYLPEVPYKNYRWCQCCDGIDEDDGTSSNNLATGICRECRGRVCGEGDCC